MRIFHEGSSLAAILYHSVSDVSLDLFLHFVSVITSTVAKIADENSADPSQLCAEFGFP
jgi:hypothetical protein